MLGFTVICIGNSHLKTYVTSSYNNFHFNRLFYEEKLSNIKAVAIQYRNSIGVLKVFMHFIVIESNNELILMNLE